MGLVYSFLGSKMHVPDAIYAGRAHKFSSNKNFKVIKYKEYPILVSKVEGRFFAIGGICPHAGGPLRKGVYENGRIHCPWHGARFDFVTGEVEDFPGFDSLPTFHAKVIKGGVYVFVDPHYEYNRPLVPPLCRMTDLNHSVVIVGSGAAGYTCAQTLRHEGYPGRIIMITKDIYLPYDKTHLTRIPGITWEECKIRSMLFYDDYDIEVMLGTTVKSIDPHDHSVYFEDSTMPRMRFDYILVATGVRPKRFAATVTGQDAPNIITMNNLEDSKEILERAPNKKVVIIGSGFVGMELASSLSPIVKSVDVVSRQKYPYDIVFGYKTGRILLNMFKKEATNFTFHPVDEVSHFELRSGGGEAKFVHTIKGRRLRCDLVVIAIGSIPNTEILSRDDILMDVHGYVPTTGLLEASIPGIYVAGDIAAFPMRVGARDRTSVGHWAVACAHGRIAALNMLGRKIGVRGVIPFYWTTLGSTKIRYTGHGQSYEDSFIFGRPGEGTFCTLYRRKKRVLAGCFVNCDPLATRLRVEMASQEKWAEILPFCVSDHFPEIPFKGEEIKGLKNYEGPHVVDKDFSFKTQRDQIRSNKEKLRLAPHKSIAALAEIARRKTDDRHDSTEGKGEDSNALRALRLLALRLQLKNKVSSGTRKESDSSANSSKTRIRWDQDSDEDIKISSLPPPIPQQENSKNEELSQDTNKPSQDPPSVAPSEVPMTSPPSITPSSDQVTHSKSRWKGLVKKANKYHALHEEWKETNWGTTIKPKPQN